MSSTSIIPADEEPRALWTLLVCNGCRYVLMFYDRSTVGDFDVQIG